MKKYPTVIFLMGPTAIGKSKLALLVKKKFPIIEIISVDSKLVYRGLNIGTDKPKIEDLKKYSHKIIDIKDPKEIYSSSDFRKDALKEIKNAISVGKIPFLVGGTMLYFKVLLNGLTFLPPSRMEIRDFIFYDLCYGIKDILFKKLQCIDWLSSKKIHPNDTKRILRALEIYFVSRKVIRYSSCNTHNVFPYNTYQFGLIPKNKDDLYKKISYRFHCMLKKGFEKEVRELYNRQDLNEFLPSINCIGYKQMWYFLEKKYSYEEMILYTLKSTRKLVKHQLTWMKKWNNLIVFNDAQIKILLQKIEKIILEKK